MRCETHCPPAASALRGPLLALAAFAAVSVAVYVVSLLGGVLVAAIAVVYAAAAAGIVVWVRMMRQPRRVVAFHEGRLSTELVAAETLALPASRPAVQGVVVSDGERIGA